MNAGDIDTSSSRRDVIEVWSTAEPAARVGFTLLTYRSLENLAKSEEEVKDVALRRSPSASGPL
jgi:hypothetical protein